MNPISKKTATLAERMMIMARPSVADKDVITVDEAIAYYGLSTITFRRYLREIDGADYLAFYRGRKLILRHQFERFLEDNPEDMKGVLTYGKSWKRTNKA